MENSSQDQARHYNLRRRQWTSAVGDVVWAKEHHLSKAAKGFAAKLALAFARDIRDYARRNGHLRGRHKDGW